MKQVLKKKIVYVTSGQSGIHSFTHNELSEIKKTNDFVLCLTQLINGPYMPRDDWDTIVLSRKKVILGFVFLLFAEPRKLYWTLIHAYKNKSIRELFAAIGFYRKIKNKKTARIHCQMGDHKLVISYYLKLFLNLPLTVTIHAHELYMRDLYFHPEKYFEIYKACEKIITISNYNKEILINKYKISESKIEVMRLFPEVNRINKISGKIKLLTVGHWVEKKGYRVLFEALKKIDRNDIVLFVVGGINKNTGSIDLEKLVVEMKLEDKVCLLGKIGGELIDVVFSACDIFCLPSYTDYYDDGKPATREGIPVALMEAMAWGMPVISTKHAGIPELVEEVLVEEKNTDELAEAILFLIKNKGQWAEMGKKNKNIIKERYTAINVNLLTNIFSS